VPGTLLDDPEYFRGRAEEARTMAEQMFDAAAKLTMLQIAESYEELAKRAERWQRAQRDKQN
jgi:hypothetical protein